MLKCLTLIYIIIMASTAQAGISNGECKIISQDELVKIQILSTDQSMVAPLAVSRLIMECHNLTRVTLNMKTGSIRDSKSGELINGGFGFKAQAYVLDENMKIIDKKQTHHYFFLKSFLKDGDYLKVSIEGFSDILVSL